MIPLGGSVCYGPDATGLCWRSAGIDGVGIFRVAGSAGAACDLNIGGGFLIAAS